MKAKKILIISFLIFLGIQISSLAYYYKTVKSTKVKAVIAEPIIIIEKMQDVIEVKVNKDMKPEEYYFTVKNYKNDIYDNKKISEIELFYNIEIKSFNNNFPISYELYDCNTGKRILKKEEIKVPKNIEYEKKYKLVIYGKNYEGPMLTNQIDIVINAYQLKK